MRAMAKFLVGLTAAVMLFVVYYVLSSRMSASVSVEVIPASMQASRFEALMQDVARGKYEGAAALGDIGEYSFVNIVVNADNYSLFTSEWAQYKLKPLDGDALVIESDAGPKDVRSFKSGRFSITILTQTSEAHREGWLEYYVFGRFHSLKVAPERAE